MSQDNNGIEAPTQAERDTFANTYIVGLHSTGPRKSVSAPGLAIVGEHSGAFGMTLEVLVECSPSNPDPLDPNEEAPKTGALQIAPGFLGPP
ncbi:hypothetical protein RHS01_09360 [Rhizoctonia solani]|uniref:Uncharacterized protein n=1 Tax=Rhizoctonia solani TaxID=456999 RepID=A0A8H7M0Y3_9AGAM|nr:hypothetical protein RHS01_09360 [Rhizoctonia solani]